MEKEFVTYEQGLALKELGFNGFCLGLFSQNHDNELFTDFKRNPLEGFVPNKCVEAPLKSQVFRWFREKHKLHSWVQPMYEDQDFYVFVLAKPKDFMIPKDINWEGDEYLNHEEAESACIDKLIEIVKTKTDEKNNNTDNNSNSRLHL